MFSFFKKTSENIARFLGRKTTKDRKKYARRDLIKSDINYEIIEKMLDNLDENVSRDALRVAIERFFRGKAIMIRLNSKR